MGLVHVFAPTELASVEQLILHYKNQLPDHVAPAELASAERVILHYTGQFLAISNSPSGSRPTRRRAANH